jgi:hypothetical protein
MPQVAREQPKYHQKTPKSHAKKMLQGETMFKCVWMALRGAG